MTIRVKSLQDDIGEYAGERYLVDRVWPEGVSEDDLELTDRKPDLAPSDEL